MRRVGSRRQRPGTFKRFPNGTEVWVSHCDRCDTEQRVVNHVMVRHSTTGEPFNDESHVATRDPRNLLSGDSHSWIQGELELEPPEPEEEPPF